MKMYLDNTTILLGVHYLPPIKDLKESEKDRDDLIPMLEFGFIVFNIIIEF